MRKNKENLFTAIPNHLIQCDISQVYNVDRKFYVIYALIDHLTTRLGTCNISIAEICKVLNIDSPRSRTTEPIKNIFSFLMNELEAITLLSPDSLDGVKLNTRIIFEIDEDNFYFYPNGFTMLTYGEFYELQRISTTSNKFENLLTVFLNVKSHIRVRSEKTYYSTQEVPKACFVGRRTFTKEIGIGTHTFKECMDLITTETENYSPLLVAISNPNMPTIYVLNKPGYQDEINGAIFQINRFRHHFNNFENLQSLQSLPSLQMQPIINSTNLIQFPKSPKSPKSHSP